MIGFGFVVEETILYVAFGDPNRNTVRSHILHLCDDAELLQRNVGGLDGVLARNGVSVQCAHVDIFGAEAQYFYAFLFDRYYSRACVA